MVRFNYPLCLPFSLFLNLLFLSSFIHRQLQLSWSQKSAEEAEQVAAIPCSGHGHAYLDGVTDQGKPICECNSCYSGSDCSEFLPHCFADAVEGDPLYLEPFWIEHATSSAVMVPGWHRMSYTMPNQSIISAELEKYIRRLHVVVGNAISEGKFIVFGVGSSQLLHAALYALAKSSRSPEPTNVVASAPYYMLYKDQTEIFNSKDFEWKGDASLWKNMSNNNSSKNFIEFVTSPNNPDGQLQHSILQGSSVKTIYDHAYYWPHYSAIPAPANEDLMIFTLSKVTGHAGSRFGWALIKDEDVYQRMAGYVDINTMGVSRDTQLRALELLKVILEDGGRAFFDFGYKTLKQRWRRLSQTITSSKHFSLQNLSSQYCTYFQTDHEPSPAYAWLKCEREEDWDCYAVLKNAGIIGRRGSNFGAEDHYVRLSLLKSSDDLNLLMQRLDDLVFKVIAKVI
ncbi:tryptophan aminotransferase-related protein 3-like [Macadamia integrifolia]|uniref:tryptophan aminotransferase-related protein 3-like n=1 Tax=Macadamia integrifolia TaxID=60698 RepID=UPI001C4E98A1|nr:tryptophan aminotransferase-related protein 3-like [Macadamia integrifolia]